MINLDMKVMVIDDFETAGQILKGQLKKLGFTNIEAITSGEEALEKIGTTKDYGLFMCDWTLKGMNGLQVLERVRGDAQLQAARFVMVTGNTTAKDVAAARAAGVNGYIVKPYNIETLRQRLASVLAS